MVQESDDFSAFDICKAVIEPEPLLLTIIGFFALSFMASANYIINDIIDKDKDKKHPEKKDRPIASGKIRVWQGIIIAIILFSAGVYLSLLLSLPFLALTYYYSFRHYLYSLFFKNEPFLDVIVLSINFVIRPISGAFVISSNFEPYIRVSSWLSCVLFPILVPCKRKKRK